MPYLNNQFEITICIEVLHHLKSEDDIITGLNELVRITQNGEHIYIAVNAHVGIGERNKYIDYNGKSIFYHYFDQFELTKLCDKIKDCKICIDNYEENHQICILNIVK